MFYNKSKKIMLMIFIFIDLIYKLNSLKPANRQMHCSTIKALIYVELTFVTLSVENVLNVP